MASAHAPSGLIVRAGGRPYELIVERIDGSGIIQQMVALNGVRQCQFSPDGRMIVVDTVVGTYSWNLESGASQQLPDGPPGWTNGVAISRDGKLVAVAVGQDVSVWNIQSGRRVVMLRGHTSEIYTLAFSPDGRFIVSGANDTTVRLWDVDTAQEMLTLEGHDHEVYDVVFNATGDKLYSLSSENGQLRSILCWPTTD